MVSRRFEVREVAVAVDERWLRIRQTLEESLGVEAASYLMERPPGGWSELVTNHTLDLKFAVLDERFRAIDERFTALEARLDGRIVGLGHELRAEMARLSRDQTWRLMTAMVASMSILTAVFGTLAVLLAR